MERFIRHIQQKSERNQLELDMKKEEKRLRGRTRLKMPAPRFSPGTELPVVPEGMILVKAFNEPAVISARRDNEPLSRRSEQFTDRQLDELISIADRKIAFIRACNPGAPYKQIGKYIRERR